MKKSLIALAVLAITVTAGCGSPANPAAAAAARPTATAGPTATASAPEAGQAATSGRYLGVYESGAPSAYSPVETFARTIRHQPKLAVYYSGWYEKFQAGFAKKAHSHGTIPLVQINPTNVSMADIANGRYDAYLRSYASQVRAFGHQVVIGFAHEMNGWWYSWGYPHTKPATWVRAWRHVVTVFRHQGARNVTWMWTVVKDGRVLNLLPRYWPGASYVNWVGIDGYFFQRSDTFQRVFLRAIRKIRTFTHKPILISETAAAPAAGKAAKIRDLFSGVIQHHLLGFVWFDTAQHGGLTHQNWRIEGNPPAVAAFRRGVIRLFG